MEVGPDPSSPLGIPKIAARGEVKNCIGADSYFKQLRTVV